MRSREIFLGKSARLEERDRQGVTHRKCRRRARGWGQSQGTGFLGHGNMDMDGGRLRQR